MSQYATIAQLEAQGLPAAALSGISDDQKTAALVAASAEVDAFLRDRGPLPLTSADDPALVQRTIDIACYRLLARRGYNPEDPAHSVIRGGYEDAMAWGRDVAAGRVVLDVEYSTSTSGSAPEVAGPEDDAEMRGW